MSNYDSGNDSIMEMYLFESETLLDQLDGILLQSEENEDLTQEDVNEIFRIMHTIKGSSAMMEFDVVAHVAHKLEDLFFVIREEGIKKEYFEDLMDLVLKVSDFLKTEVEKIQTGQPLSEGNEDLVDEVQGLLNHLKDGLAQEEVTVSEDLSSISIPAPVSISKSMVVVGATI